MDVTDVDVQLVIAVGGITNLKGQASAFDSSSTELDQAFPINGNEAIYPMEQKKRLAALLLAVCLLLSLTACGQKTDSAGDEPATPKVNRS